MKKFKKHLCLLLIPILLATYMLSGCKKKDKAEESPSPGVEQQEETDEPEPEQQEPEPEQKPPEQGGREEPWIPAEELVYEPSSLGEFLDSESTDAGDLLDSPDIADEILGAESLEDIVNGPDDADKLRGLSDEIGDMLDEPGGDGEEEEKLAQIKEKIDELFADAEPTPQQLDASTELKGTWSEPNRVLLRWIPQIEWLPENGYYLYRIVDGEASVIASDLGSASKINQIAGLDLQFSPIIADLYQQSVLDEAKMNIIGISTVQQFNDMAFGEMYLNSDLLKISGQDAFEKKSSNIFQKTETVVEKIPQNDIFANMSIHLASQINTVVLPIGSADAVPETQGPGIIPTPELTLPEETILDIMDARNSMLTLANTDSEFAEAVGFGYEDNLGDTEYETNKEIEYVLLPLGEGVQIPETSSVKDENAREGMYSLKVSYGAETPIEAPAEMQGYGADGEVHLRWSQPATDYGAGIISGYYVERRMEDEDGFTRLNEVPIAISYMEDEDNILYEVADYYVDYDVENGDKAVYRVQALDIFGRLSEFNPEPISVEVKKTVPPGPPEADQPVLTTKAGSRSESYFTDIGVKYPGEKGIILPITATTDDTTSCIVYRSSAWGGGSFSQPVEVGRIKIPEDKNEIVFDKRGTTETIVPRKTDAADTDAVFLDVDVTPGYFYKYWVSAVDDWENESAWSASKVIGYRTEAKPQVPESAQASMTFNILPDLSLGAVGFMEGRLIAPDMFADINIGGIPAMEGYIPRSNVDTTPVQQAMEKNIQIGVSLSETVRSKISLIPQILDIQFANMPEAKDVHDIIALREQDVENDGSVDVSWYHYAGDGLGSYNVYRTYVDGGDLDDIMTMSIPDILEDYSWSLVESDTIYNRITDTVEKKAGRIYLYMISLVPQEAQTEEDEGYGGYLPAGWVRMSWERPEDLQISHFKVYKAEVSYFDENDNPDNLDWTLVGDNLEYAGYSEDVDQTHAHYYYYKVTSVSVWGVESDEYALASIRVPSTVPPETPVMLIPFPQKGAVEVRWNGVPYAGKYKIYKVKMPRVKEEDIADLQIATPNLFNKIFTPELGLQIYLPEMQIVPFSSENPQYGNTVSGLTIPSSTVTKAVSNFNTMRLLEPQSIMNDIQASSIGEKVDAYNTIVDKYGVLAAAPYGFLDAAAAKLVNWEVVHEVEIPLGQQSTGEFSYVDEDVEFGETYMYTVSAENDDGLVSERPEPVSVSPRKGEPFPPVTGVTAQIDEDTGQPEIRWNPAKDPNLSVAESEEFIAGYIVYRSKTKDGEYHQASPFLTEEAYIDQEADPAAFNWYKVKVVDIGGYTSDYSSAVSTGGIRTFILPAGTFQKTIIKPNIVIPILPSGEEGQTPADLTAETIFNPIITLPPIIINFNIPETVKMAGFDIINITTTDTGSPKKGEGDLVLANKYTVPVSLTVTSWNDQNEVTDGSLALKQPVQVGNTGVHITELIASTAINKGLASGYVVKAGSQDTENLMGDLYSLRFNDTDISPGGVIKITEIPEFRYNNIKISGMDSITVNLNAFDATAPAVVQQESIFILGKQTFFLFGTGFINLMDGTAENDLGMETMDNKGLEYGFSILNFDKDGRMNGTMTISDVKMMRTVIPAGLGIKTSDSKLVYSNGQPDESKSYLKGKVMFPFETFVDDAPIYVDFESIAKTRLGDTLVNKTDISSILGSNPDLVKSGSQQISTVQKGIVDVGMFYIAEQAQLNTLLVLPLELMETEAVSNIPFEATDWDGRGFTVANKSLMPTLVGNDDEEVGIIGSSVTIDLDREDATADAMTDETRDNGWTGLIVKSGRVSLPPAFIKTEQDKRVSFNLTPGEMIYDRNGFYYQSQAYSPQGIPVNFGDQLGGFRDAYANSIYIDLYNNKVNLEIKGSIGIPLFGFQRANVTIYTSEELGKLVCSVDETEKFDPAGTGEVYLSITGGHLLPDGLHMNGTLDMNFTGGIEAENIRYTELIIPAEMEILKEENNPDGLLGSAMFDMPYKIKFHDFDMEIRALSMVTRDSSYQVGGLAEKLKTGIGRTFKVIGLTMPATGTVQYYATDLSLWGGMQLSDTLSIDTKEDFDRVVISDVFRNPAINYEESKSKINMEFEEFAHIDAVATPKLVDESSGIIEYETDSLEMLFNTAMDVFSSVEIESNARLGYDRTMGRFFFALAIYYNDPTGGIQFGYGRINDITGVVGYNLDIAYSEEEGYIFPEEKQGLFNAIDTMDVNRDPGGNYFLAATAWMYLGYDTGSVELQLGEVRNMYMVVEKGPTVEMGGKYYGPSEITSLMTGNDLKHMGTVRIGYYHRDRLFKFSLTLNDFGMYGFKINGDVSFEMSPNYWMLNIGYPNTLQASLGSMVNAGFALAIKNTFPPVENYIKAKMDFEYDTGYVTIAIVYFRAYLRVGAEGEFHFPGDYLYLSAYIQGGLEGGIKVAGKRYNIISLHLDARGELEKRHSDWRLEAKVKIRYHLSLLFTSVGGSVTWKMKLSF